MRIRSINLTVGILSVVGLLLTGCLKNSDNVPPDFNEQLQKDVAAIDTYLAANGITAVQESHGLRYIIYRHGGGNQPTIDSCVTSNYQGKFLTNGIEFDQADNASFPLKDVIDGWKIGIPLLHEGDSATLYVPSGLAYGYYGYPPDIPSNANMIFNVGLKKVGTTYKTSDHSCD
jgi:FKBP-type peptidyl-prolyl cis-trans isomerase FkpA